MNTVNKITDKLLEDIKKKCEIFEFSKGKWISQGKILVNIEVLKIIKKAIKYSFEEGRKSL